MTNPFSRIFAVLLLAVASTTALAQSGGIAVVDVQAAMLATDYAQALVEQKRNEPEFAKLNSTYEALRADLQAMAAEAQANAASWTPDQIEENNKLIQYTNADLQLAVQKIEAEQQEVFSQIEIDLQPLALAAIEELIQAEGVTLLLERSAVMYGDPSLNLTEKLIVKLNETTAEQ